MLEALKLPKGSLDLGVLQSGWVVTYRHPTKHHIELTVFTQTRPKKKATFKIKNARRRLEAVSVRKINKEAVNSMATKTKAKASKKKKVDEDELDELEGLEDLEDLEDLDEDEPEDEDEDEEDEDEEDEEPAPKKKGKTKKAPAKKGKRKKAAAEEDEDDDEDDDDEDEDDESPAKKSKAKKGKGKKKGAKAAPGEKIKGLSPQGVAELAEELGYSTDARAVRVFLRNNEDEFPKDDKFRYDFTKSEAKAIIKRMKRKD